MSGFLIYSTEVSSASAARASEFEKRVATPSGKQLDRNQPSQGASSESVGWQNFGKMLLVFGCIGSDFCKKICVLQHFSKSTRFSS